ncbi:hypothetical protein ACFC0K_41320 [Streptomyces hydrogenans]|uniref:hypothetical protein n=1 Tax=Streptomyces hydrogenans TaxID=1873719 RepID=UPI0035DE80E2
MKSATKFRVSALTLAIVFFSAACSSSEKLVTVSTASVSGAWKGDGGEMIILQEDHGFRTSGIDWHSISPGNGCPQGDVAGRWSFWGSDPGSPQTASALEKYTEGDTVNLGFEKDAQGTCLIDLNVVGEGDSLCVTNDMDISCALDIRFHRER